MRIKALTWNCYKDIVIWHNWYKERFPNAEFTIYDNESDEINIPKDLGIEVITFKSNNKFDDRENVKLKNQKFNEGWIIFGDIDELVDINEETIKKEESLGTTIFRFKAFDRFDNQYLLRNPRWDKPICWNSSELKPNFTFGAHNAQPTGNVKWSSIEYPLIHNKYPSEDDFVNKRLIYKERFEEWNKSVGHGIEYFRTEGELRNEYKTLKEKSKKLWQV